MNKVQESIEKNIEKLNIDAKAKTALYQIQTIARSDAPYRKQLVPNLLLVSPSGAGTTEYGKVYSRIIDENHIYDIRGLSTFLELDFPCDDSPREYNLFFSSRLQRRIIFMAHFCCLSHVLRAGICLPIRTLIRCLSL